MMGGDSSDPQQQDVAVDPSRQGMVPRAPQADRSPIIHHVEFRSDGAVEVTLSETEHLGERAAMSKLITLHPDLVPPDELEDVLDTLTDWTDVAWRALRSSGSTDGTG